MPIKTISSAILPVVRIFITVWVVGWGLSLPGIISERTHISLNGGVTLLQARLEFIGFWIIGLLFWFTLCVGLKKVAIDDKNIYVSNWFRKATIPANSISDVMGGKLGGILVLVRFKKPTPFGKQITFVAQRADGRSGDRRNGSKLLFWRQHPVVAELKQFAHLEE